MILLSYVFQSKIQQSLNCYAWMTMIWIWAWRIRSKHYRHFFLQNFYIKACSTYLKRKQFFFYIFNTHHAFLHTYFMKYSWLYEILPFVYFMQLYFHIRFGISILCVFVILMWDAGKICNIDSKMSLCIIFDCIFYQQNNIELL